MAIKYISPEEAAMLIKDGDNVGFSGFTHAGCPKVVPVALAKRAEVEHEKGNPFKIGVLTGASTGDAIDGSLSRAKAIKFRTPYQTNKDIRKAINEQELEFFDMHLSHLAQEIRYNFFGDIDVAIIEACEVTESGEIVPTIGVGISPTVCRLAKTVIVELNSNIPKSLRGLHDICELENPPNREHLRIYDVKDRVGRDCIKVSPEKIYVVKTAEEGNGGAFSPVDETTTKIGDNVANFFVREMKEGRMPSTFLPVQSGVGNIANAVLSSMGSNDEIPNFEVYTEVIQDAVIDMMRDGKITFASGCSLTVSNDQLERLLNEYDFFKDKLVLRPVEISNNPGIVRRLGIIAINTAIEADIFGGINSTHIMGTSMMNGIGGSGDFTRNSYVSIFVTPSIAKNGAISSIVPKVTHEDHSEHSVKIIITEQGIADLRGKGPMERAREIIDKCAHPDYKELLTRYLENGTKGHIPQDIYTCFAFHKAFLETGDMRNAKLDK